MSAAGAGAPPTIVLIGGTDPWVRLGGHETYALAYAEAAARAGFATHLFYVTAQAPPPDAARGWTPHPVRSPVRPLRTMMALAHAPFVARAIARFVRTVDGPVVLHALGPWAAVAAAVRRMLARRGRRVAAVATAYTTLHHEFRAKLAGVSEVHGIAARLNYLVEDGWIRGFARHGERRGYDAMDLLLVNYDSVRAILAAEHGLRVPVRRFPYAPLSAFADRDAGRAPGAPPPAVAPLRPAGAPLIVAVSRQDPRKGIDRLVRALGALHADGVPFRACLIGTGRLLAAHRALADRLGLAAGTALPGRVEDAFAVLRAADVFVLPSLEEGSGSLALIEAMQAGCAIVATRVDGIPEDVDDGENGVLADPDDPLALRDALARVLGDAALRTRLATAARATFERRFAAPALVSAVRALYTELARCRA